MSWFHEIIVGTLDIIADWGVIDSFQFWFQTKIVRVMAEVLSSFFDRSAVLAAVENMMVTDLRDIVPKPHVLLLNVTILRGRQVTIGKADKHQWERWTSDKGEGREATMSKAE